MGLGALEFLQDRGWKAAGGRYGCIASVFWVPPFPLPLARVNLPYPSGNSPLPYLGLHGAKGQRCHDKGDAVTKEMP